MNPAPPRAQRGSTLVEALVALVLLGVALLMGLPLLMEQPGAVRRLDAHRRALRTLDSTLEALRTGGLPLEAGWHDPGTGAPPVRIEIAPEPEPPGLYRVALRAVYRVRDRTFEKRVESLLWRPAP